MFLPIVHVSDASTGVVVSSMSLPYRQSPASRRSVSLAPRPISITLALDDPVRALANSSALSALTEI